MWENQEGKVIPTDHTGLAENVSVLAGTEHGTLGITQVDLAESALNKHHRTGACYGLPNRQSACPRSECLETTRSSYKTINCSSSWNANHFNSTEYFQVLSVSTTTTLATSEAPAPKSPRCLLIDSRLPFCKSMLCGGQLSQSQQRGGHPDCSGGVGVALAVMLPP